MEFDKNKMLEYLNELETVLKGLKPRLITEKNNKSYVNDTKLKKDFVLNNMIYYIIDLFLEYIFMFKNNKRISGFLLLRNIIEILSSFDFIFNYNKNGSESDKARAFLYYGEIKDLELKKDKDIVEIKKFEEIYEKLLKNMYGKDFKFKKRNKNSWYGENNLFILDKSDELKVFNEDIKKIFYSFLSKYSHPSIYMAEINHKTIKGDPFNISYASVLIIDFILKNLNKRKKVFVGVKNILEKENKIKEINLQLWRESLKYEEWDNLERIKLELENKLKKEEDDEKWIKWIGEELLNRKNK